ncbi:MAG: hypothetical protein HY276_08915 [Ignavibacteriales bacterium]|nr:hypothetical protein [Ignavibacteriales bacterium]
MDHKKYPVVPANELRCVWMTAGILSYQLCNRKFDCEDCPLDSAMRMHFSQQASNSRISKQPYSTSLERQKLRPEFHYNRKHCWIKRQDRSSIRIGIEPRLASVLVSPRAIVLPSIGEQVQKNKVCAWVVTEGGTLQITSPMDGEVWDVNTSLADRPHDLCDYPMDRGWMFELVIKEEELEQADLLQMTEAETIYDSDEAKFQLAVKMELEKSYEATGATLPDGGQFLQSVADMLGVEKYFKLVREVFM